MNWNIFKRVDELKQQVKDLTDFNNDNSRWIVRLGERAQKLESANQNLINSNQALIGRHENIGKRLQDLEHQVYLQSRDPRIAALEQQVKELLDFINDEDRRIEDIEVKLKKLDNATFIHSVQLNSQYSEVPPMPSLVDEEKEKKRQYQREWYAKRQAKLKQEKNAQAAREKKNAYHRAYYARTKGAKNA
jgi:hypothetical protein